MRSRWAGCAVGLVALANVFLDPPTFAFSTIGETQLLASAEAASGALSEPIEPDTTAEPVDQAGNQTDNQLGRFGLRVGRRLGDTEAAVMFARTAEPTALIPETTVTTAVTTTTAPAPPREFTIAATGDLLIHGPVARTARNNGTADKRYDFDPMFALVKPYLSEADLAICHLETPLSEDNRSVTSFPLFSVPFQLADAIAAAGYDTCSTASNHSLDKGAEGVDATLDHLDRVGVDHVGTARTPQERAAPVTYDVNGVTIGHLSYSFDFNGIPHPGGHTWTANEIDVSTILRDVTRTRAAGAEFVVLSLHWGVEYRTLPTDEQLEQARRLMASPEVDLILGHHAHTVQPMGRLNGKPVVFGMGNFLSNQSAACCGSGSQDGVIVRLHVQENFEQGFAVDAVDFVPTYVERPTYRIIPVEDALRDSSLSDVGETTLRRSKERTNTALSALDDQPVGDAQRGGPS